MPRRNPEKLHHLKDGKNDWDGLADHEMNFLQKVAKKTRGIVTAANAITITGTILAMNGLMDIATGDKALGVAKIGAGRLCDVADGEIAELTDTKGNVGRVLDPTVDMVQLGVGLPVLVSSELMPLAAAAIVGAPKAATAVSSVVGFFRGKKPYVPEEAKLGTTAIWTGMGAFAVRAVFDKYLPGAVDVGLETAGWVGTVGGTIYQREATIGYMKSGFGPVDLPESEAA